MNVQVVQFLGGPLCGVAEVFAAGTLIPSFWPVIKPGIELVKAIRDGDLQATIPVVKGYYRFAPCCEGGDGLYHWQGWEK